ncbi:hypothetical protein [Flavobacterium celericrescens]|nr:hypothetical protein [Flavobacterium celericrescens]
MMPFEDIKFTIKTFHKHGLTKEAALWLLKIYQIEHPNFAGFEFREAAKPDFILMTTEGEIGNPQIIRIPENTFEFPLILMLNLLAHEMMHVKQKSKEIALQDKNEREWQAYYEMLFHKEFPLVPIATVYHQKFFAEKAMIYYNRSEKEANPLRLKYEAQKKEIEELIVKLE